MKKFCLVLSILLLYLWAAVSLYPELQHVFLYVSVIGTFLLSLIAVPQGQITKEFKLFLILCLWMFMSVVWAKSQTLVMSQISRILAVLIFSWTLQRLSYDNKAIPWLYFAWVISFVAIFLYVNTHITSMGFSLGSERFEDDVINANTPAYFLFFTTFSLFIIAEIIHNVRLVKWLKIAFLLTIPLMFYVAMFSGARQVLIVMIPLFAALLYYRYFNQTSFSNRFVFLSLTIVVLAVVLATNVVNVFDDSILHDRMVNKNIGDDERTILLKEAIEVGNSHFFLGVGMGNFQLFSSQGGFSHCSYTELYANNGIFAAILFIYMLFSFLRKQWLRYKLYKDKHFACFFAFGLIYALYNFFYVFYLNPWLFGFFMLVASHAESYYKNKFFQKI